MAIAQTDQDLKENTRIPELTERKKEVDKSIQNILKVIEKGVASDTLVNRLTELEKEAKNIEVLLKDEERYVFRIDKWQIVYWLKQFKNGDINDPDFRRHIIDLLVNSVTVWDEPDGFRITTAYNLTSTPNRTYRVDNSTRCSDLECLSPPLDAYPNSIYFVWGTVLVQTTRHPLP